jgi:hypothetical protein
MGRYQMDLQAIIKGADFANISRHCPSLPEEIEFSRAVLPAEENPPDDE